MADALLSYKKPDAFLLGSFGLTLENGDIKQADGLDTAVIISLFTDRRALEDDATPDFTENRRGWWGDTYDAQQRPIGSRLWLLSREKQTPWF